MKRYRITILLMFVALVLGTLSVSAQNIRYVKMATAGGNNANDGMSWTTAKADIQDAINDLVNNNQTGEVWVAAGTYYPTESTEASDSLCYKAFKIPAGITVRGGFKGNVTADDAKGIVAYAGETTIADRRTIDDKNFGNGDKSSDTDDAPNIGTLDGEEYRSGVYESKTILCGDLTPGKGSKLEWNEKKQQFDATFYGNSHHVVWFATNGFDENGRALPLSAPAKLEGCVVQGGHAFSNDVYTEHPHQGYGGGIYMVANAFVYNSEVRNCDASRNGGGIYMDGGGIVRRTYVHDCQALGIGAEYGLGGGICEEGSVRNSTANPIVVAQSAVTNCVGRKGGGMALVADQTVGKNKYSIVANSTLVNNNTATVEAGGVYTYKGGGVANLTIVQNKCNGSGIMQNDVITGRAGGLYNRDATLIANTVIWGNECKSNQDVQYASSRTNLTDAEKTTFYYNAVSHTDLTDWSACKRLGILSLNDVNNGAEGHSAKGYPLFFNPTLLSGYTELIDMLGIDWKVSSESYLTFAGINTADLDHDGLTPAPKGKSYDMQFCEYNSRPSIGAFVSEVVKITPATAVTYDGVEYAKALFVDPEFVYGTDNNGSDGTSWAEPMRFLGNALDYVARQRTLGNNERFAIFVKEGTVDNTRSAGGSRIRATSLDMPSSVSVFGSFDADLTGTDLTKRNPVLTPTIISGKLLDDYKYNVAHLINIEGSSNIVLDGFKLSFANAYSTEMYNDNRNGAAITIKNSGKGIHFRNITVSNCYGDKGTVVYADNSAADFENCIFHNNTTATIEGNGLIYGIKSHLRFDHCNVLRSVGHASYLDAHTTNVWNNSMFYGNLDRAQENTNSSDQYSTLAFEGHIAGVSGERNMFDRKSYAAYNARLGGGIPAQSTYHQTNNYAKGTPGVSDELAGKDIHYGLNYVYKSGTANGYPRMVNPTKNAGYSIDGDITYYGRATSFEPHNDNPVVNAASSAGEHTAWGKDITTVITRDFGGLPDIGAVESHSVGIHDITHVNGNPDGQMPYGTVLYVRDYGNDMSTKDRDGTSWERAINGNATYRLSGTRRYKDFSEVAVLAYRINSGKDYLDVRNETLNRIDGTSYANENDETHNPSATCSVFILCDEEGNELLYDSGKTPADAKRLKDASTGEYLYLDYTNGVYSFRISANPPADQATATITASSSDYKIQYKANNQSRYLYNSNGLVSTSSTAWTFTSACKVKLQHGIGKEKTERYDMGEFTGLQYAVNKANIAFRDEYSLTDDLQKSRKQIWVGAGVYRRDPAKNAVADPIVDMDDENCFVIQDGVDVYGAFPKTGNPGMGERQTLVSQYVHVQAERHCNPADYETILQPATTGVKAGAKRRVLGQPYKRNPDIDNDAKRKENGGITYCGIDYIGVVWDGFTLRNGVWDSKGLNRPNRYGGAGAAIYRNVTLKNVVVTNNTTIFSDAAGQELRAGGIYMDGGTLDAGYVINNVLQGWTTDTNQPSQEGTACGGGMYIYTGTVFNSVIANNRIHSAYSDGAGAFIENSNFFNNTIVNNKAEGTSRASGGIAVWANPDHGTGGKLKLYNSIIANNEGFKADANTLGNADVCLPREGMLELHNSITTATANEKRNKSWIEYVHCEAVTDYSAIFQNPGSATGDFKDFDLRLRSTAGKAINQGYDAPVMGGAVYNLTDYSDMDFAERIQDCRIDIGAYEYNGSTDVSPDIASVSGQAVFYVTPEGKGISSGNDPENAACASKLQKIIDAAGRYKLTHPDRQVIVKVANSYDLLHPDNDTKKPGDDGYTSQENFTYYATRTTNLNSTDTRIWSIQIPRGVEVWGGYADVPTTTDGNGNIVKDTSHAWSNANNGFQHRSITGNPTYFDSYFYNKDMKINATTYHVVTFTDRVFDADGMPYLAKDFADGILAAKSSYAGEREETAFLHISQVVKGNVMATKVNGKTVSNRAVLDGIFVTGGNADGKTISGSTNLNTNGYGGAAIVTDYAYVRNCVVMNNKATNGGGLALTHRALVSGSLIIENSADNHGGGLYVFEDGAVLSDGTHISSAAPEGKVMDYNMAHVFTSTIARNTAQQQGGGIWYTDNINTNVRFNSVAVWSNTASDQNNVFGMVNPEQPVDDETLSEIFYPFSYSAIENVRASGTNNLSVGSANHQGVRFVNKASDYGTASPNLIAMAAEQEEGNRYQQFGYYGLSTYSVLCSNGMPKRLYEKVRDAMAISDDDLLGNPRTYDDNNFIEIGARALAKQMPRKQLMLRLFVSHPEDVDTDHAQNYMALTGKPGSAEEYYSQMGSSFAYPFNFLQDALDYVKMARNGEIFPEAGAQNLPFEILVGKGTYYPKKDLNGETQSVWTQTFAIPEGVTLIGGFNPQGGFIVTTDSEGDHHITYTYYGRYHKPAINKANTSIYDNVAIIPKDGPAKGEHEIGRGNKYGAETVSVGGENIIFQQWSLQDIADRRAMSDNNRNGIIEPWEFINQTVISGNAVNGETDGVYHIMTAVADEDAVGRLPKVQATNPAFVGLAANGEGDPSKETGYQWKEQGQQICLNGLIITGGNALTYLSTALDEYGKYIFYQGAGLQVDGNRYKNNSNNRLTGAAVFHNSAAYGVGYRDIPVAVINCHFRNNKAGYGGAISTNGTLSLFSSSFEQNLAIAQTETPESGEEWFTMVSGERQKVDKVMYPGQGGAILATHQLSAFNTLFANNEACMGEGETPTINLVKHPTFRVPVEANASSTIRAAGGAIMMGSAAEHHIVNCNFVRNKANAYPAIFTMNPTVDQNPEHTLRKEIDTHYYSQIINTVAWGNEVNAISSDPNYLTASRLMVNVGKKNRTRHYITDKSQKDFYNPAFLPGNVPTKADLEAGASTPGNWQEAVWYCAYEDGVGFRPSCKTTNTQMTDAIIYSPKLYAPAMLAAANGGIYQNCNIRIVADNTAADGPNFGKPSVKAGCDGFMEGADWSPALVNPLIDNGNGWIRQTVNPATLDVTFRNLGKDKTSYQGAYPVTHYLTDLTRDHQFPEYKYWLSIGNEKYMEATDRQESAEQTINGTSIGKPQKNIPRIAPDPTVGATKAYIDIGVYEYVK